MADKVIICGLRRGGSLVPQSEILQMAGRCGRVADSLSTPKVYLLVEDEDLGEAEKYLHSKPPSIGSHMSVIDNAMFHVLPEVCAGRVKDADGVREWFRRSFSSRIDGTVDADAVMQVLCESGMISRVGDKMVVQPMAHISTSHLFHPFVLSRWIEKAETVIQADRLADPTSIAWLLARKDSVRFKPDTELLEDYTSMCCAYGYDIEEGETLSGLVYYCLLTQRRPQAMKYQMSEYRDDASRVLSAMQELDKLHNWMQHAAWRTIKIRLTRGVDEETATLMSNTGMRSKAMAIQLSELGFHTIDDIRNGLDLVEEVDANLHRRVKELLYGTKA